MSTVGQPEKKTQQRVVKLFLDTLKYDHLGDWTEREGNRNIEEALLKKFLREKQGYEEALITRALYDLDKAAGDTKAQGSRQNLDSQKKVFIQPFFSTIQWVMAGNDTEGLSYGTIETPEKYYLKWKE